MVTLIESLVDQRVEAISEKVESDTDYVKCVDKQHQLFKEIKEMLPAERELTVNRLCDEFNKSAIIETTIAYQEGFWDGMRMCKMLAEKLSDT